ncbi:hypothetical protein Tco_1205153 [Tanacetum coccineum]
MTSATRGKGIHQRSTRSIVHTVNGLYSKILRALRMYDRIEELEARCCEHTTAENQREWSEAEASRATFLAWVRFADAFARYDSGGASGSGGSRARDREDGDDTGGEDGGDDTNFSPATCRWGKILPLWHQFLDQKIRGAHFSLGIVAGERFAIELTPSTFPQRHFAGEMFPQRHVAGEKVGMLLGKASNVVVLGVCYDGFSLTIVNVMWVCYPILSKLLCEFDICILKRT